jgi:hypothetical protein
MKNTIIFLNSCFCSYCCLEFDGSCSLKKDKKLNLGFSLPKNDPISPNEGHIFSMFHKSEKASKKLDLPISSNITLRSSFVISKPKLLTLMHLLLFLGKIFLFCLMIFMGGTLYIFFFPLDWSLFL